MKKGDIFVIVSILLLEAALAFIFLSPATREGGVIVELNNEEIYCLSLSGNGGPFEIHGNTGKVIIIIENGRACVAYAECPDQICVKTGWLSKQGQVAACVPNGVLIRISSSENDGPDVVLK